MLSGPPILWRQPFSEMEDADLAQLYRDHRAALLAAHHRRYPNSLPDIAWMIEDGIPDRLRRLPEWAHDGGLFLATGERHPSWIEREAVVQEREAFLLRQRFFGGA